MEKELYTERVSAGRRNYFLDVRQSINGENYLTITESKKKNDGTFERHKVMLFSEDLEKFAEAFIRTILKMK